MFSPSVVEQLTAFDDVIWDTNHILKKKSLIQLKSLDMICYVWFELTLKYVILLWYNKL